MSTVVSLPRFYILHVTCKIVKMTIEFFVYAWFYVKVNKNHHHHHHHHALCINAKAGALYQCSGLKAKEERQLGASASCTCIVWSVTFASHLDIVRNASFPRRPPEVFAGQFPLLKRLSLLLFMFYRRVQKGERDQVLVRGFRMLSKERA